MIKGMSCRAMHGRFGAFFVALTILFSASAAPVNKATNSSRATNRNSQKSATPKDTTTPLFEQWVAQGLQLLEKSPRMLENFRGLDSAKLQKLTVEKTAPWSVSSTLEDAVTQTDPLTDPNKINDISLSNKLNYKNKDSWQATLSTTNSYYTLSDPTSYSSNPPYTIGLRLQYDLIQGGADGAEHLRDRLSQISANQAGLGKESAILAERIQFYQVMADLFVTQCKINGVNGARNEVAETIKSGYLQVKTRTIGYKDYLNFLDLQNNFSRRLAGLESQKNSFMQQLYMWGVDVQKFSQTVDGFQKVCDPDIDETVRRADASISPEENLQTMVRRMPEFISADLQRKASEIQITATELEQKMSLTPYASGTYSKRDFSDGKSYGGAIGITLTYNFPGERGDVVVQGSRVKLEESLQNLQNSFFSKLSKLASLQSQVLSQKNILDVLKLSLTNSEKLLNTLEAQRAIGQVDSLSYTNSFINKIDAGHALLDSWSTLEKTTYELLQYKQSASATKLQWEKY